MARASSSEASTRTVTSERAAEEIEAGRYLCVKMRAARGARSRTAQVSEVLDGGSEDPAPPRQVTLSFNETYWAYYRPKRRCTEQGVPGATGASEGLLVLCIVF